MITAAIYARYSSDHQRAASIEDQLRLCREHAARQGWTVVASYADRATSGASLLRPGIQELIAEAPRGRFKVVVAEALDRLSRDQEDVAAVYKRLSFQGVRIVTLAEGEISPLHVGLKGTMNALFLKDLADKTRRGLRGRIEDGRSAGGRCYGYELVKRAGPDGEPVRGERRLNDAEAAVVRRVFRDFAIGRSPRAIARDLNNEGVPGPGGRPWMDTMIRGHIRRGTGIINNELYVGRLVWNRQRFVKDPDTGRRVSRPNPEAEWIVREVPELRVVDQELWERVKMRQQELTEVYEANVKTVRASHSNRLNLRHRRRFLLSGLLVCGLCGGGYTIRGKDRYGCARRHNRGTCSNARTIPRGAIEARVLSGLKDRLLAPDLVAEFVRAFQEEADRLRRERGAAREADRRALAGVERAIQGLIMAIEDGLYQPSMKARLAELERRKAELAARLAGAEEDRLPAIHPAIAEIYRAKVARLEEALGRPEDRAEAAEALRALIERIVLTPGARRGEVEAELFGELGAILALAADGGRTKQSRTPAGAGVRLSVVAGVGFEPTTFRL